MDVVDDEKKPKAKDHRRTKKKRKRFARDEWVVKNRTGMKASNQTNNSSAERLSNDRITNDDDDDWHFLSSSLKSELMTSKLNGEPVINDDTSVAEEPVTLERTTEKTNFITNKFTTAVAIATTTVAMATTSVAETTTDTMDEDTQPIIDDIPMVDNDDIPMVDNEDPNGHKDKVGTSEEDEAVLIFGDPWITASTQKPSLKREQDDFSNDETGELESNSERGNKAEEPCFETHDKWQIF